MSMFDMIPKVKPSAAAKPKTRSTTKKGGKKNAKRQS